MNNLRWVRQRTICGRIRRLRRDESGVLLIITALLLPILLAILGLSLDVGIIYDDKRRQQNAADSGAMGGAHELWRGNTDKVQSSAKDDTKRNGFDDNDSDVTVTVTNIALTAEMRTRSRSSSPKRYRCISLAFLE